MGFNFRKSVKIGGIRLNASKSGIGVSTGVKGARFGINSKGKSYTSIGRNGFSYRKSFGNKKIWNKRAVSVLNMKSSQLKSQKKVG